ncbi:MAG: hypothetical protein AAF518_21800 [Spirochaetota bacterium]
MRNSLVIASFSVASWFSLSMKIPFLLFARRNKKNTSILGAIFFSKGMQKQRFDLAQEESDDITKVRIVCHSAERLTQWVHMNVNTVVLIYSVS